MSLPMLEAVLAGALAGLIGVQVVQRRLAFVTMALTHATFPGVVAAAIAGLPLAVGGVLAGSVVALGVPALSRRRGQDTAAATGVLLAGGFALGAGLVATQDGFSRDLSAFLVGSILTAGPADVVTAAAVLAVVAAVLGVLSRQLAFSGFDPAGARAAGHRVGLVDVVLVCTVQLVVVAIVPAVGTILAVALIVGPAAAARRWTDRPALITPLAVAFGMLSGVAGLLASSRWDVAAGGAITLTVTGILAVSVVGGAVVHPPFTGRRGWMHRRLLRSRHD